jgi:hypothetical protein
MTGAILRRMGRPGQGAAMQAWLAHYVAITVWSESLRRLPALPEERRVPYYLGFANACIGLSAVSTGMGYYALGVVPGPVAAGLLFLSPVFFLVSIVAGARHVADALAIGLGFALAPLFDRLVGGGFDLILAGLVGGGAAFAIRRWRRG